MAEVLQYLGVPLNHWAALSFVFLVCFAIAMVTRSVWHLTLHALRIAALNSVAKEALLWATKSQLSVGWLAVALVCNGAMVFALRLSQQGDLEAAMVVFLLIVYAIPILILRPRWLGVSTDDISRAPGFAAIGAFVLLAMLDWVIAAGFDALMGKLGGLLSFVSTMFLIWLTASFLLFVRGANDFRPHLASRMNLRFLALIVLGSARPIVSFMVWLMPVLLLALHYSIFIGPAVSQLAPFLPDVISMAHRLFLSFANVFSDYWWIASITLVTVVWNLYVGRCLMVFEDRRQTSSRNTVFNTFP